MDNSTKPTGTNCPKCDGFYSWTEPFGRCLMCGYAWNPTIATSLFKIPHCCFGQCVRPIDTLEQVFCPNHVGEAVNESAKKNIEKQRRYTQRKANQDDGQIRLNAPIMVKLKTHYKNTVA